MKGYIKIEAATHEGKEGLSVETDLQDVSYMDRIAVLHGVCNVLHISPSELKLMAGMISSGFMEEMTDIIDLKGEPKVAQKPEFDKHKKPNVHVIGGDAEDMLELLRELLS